MLGSYSLIMATVSSSSASKSAPSTRSASSSKAPTESARPKSKPSSLGSVRPQARPDSLGQVRPQPRPDSVAVSAEAARNAPPSDRVSGLLGGLMDNYGAGTTSERIAERAEALVGTQFKPDDAAQCAAFVSETVSSSGTKPEGFRETVRARDFAAMGAEKIASMEDLQPGDIVSFNNTYRFSQNEGDHTHVGVYAGEGQFIHRPTQNAGYRPGSAAGEVIKENMQEYIDRDRGRFEASFAGAYRFGN